MAALLWIFILTYLGRNIYGNNANSGRVNVTHVVSKDTSVFEKAFNLTESQENVTLTPPLLPTEQSATAPVSDGGEAETSTLNTTGFKITENFTSTNIQTTETSFIPTSETETAPETGGISSLPLPLSGLLPQPVSEVLSAERLKSPRQTGCETESGQKEKG
ncbi:hypothetical protein Baya_7929 [Bagarius yarrelli]|uniref:Uncharacterized protein n=1 Tax=Bagarius yarrelli TaxID=175774 RepID=A0A556U2R2_BAGYA|nr:hypothetical protein Baya_7929 [Bagarius yarrelli]